MKKINNLIIMILIGIITLVGCGESIESIEEIIVNVDSAFTSEMHKKITDQKIAQKNLFPSNLYGQDVFNIVGNYSNEEMLNNKILKIQKLSSKLDNSETISKDATQAIECIAFNKFLIKKIKNAFDEFNKTLNDHNIVDDERGTALNILIRTIGNDLNTDNIFYNKVSEAIKLELSTNFSEKDMTTMMIYALGSVVAENTLTKEQVQWDRLKLNQEEYIKWLNIIGEDSYRNLTLKLKQNIERMTTTKTLGIFQDISLASYKVRTGRIRKWDINAVVIKGIFFNY